MSRDSYAKTAVRRAAILEVAMTGEVSTAELAERFGVTLSTIRRDVAQLAAEGRVARTYGGVTVPRSTLELDIAQKTRQRPQEKRDIARAAARHVRPGEVIVIDAGTTAGLLAQAVREVPDLTVVTGGMTALLALHDAPAVDLIVIGGRLRQINQGMVGPLAEYGLGLVAADRAFLGAEGLDPELGISCPTLEQATLKNRMMASAKEVYLLVDHSKLGRRPFRFHARLPDHAVIITDAGASDDTLATLTARWTVERAERRPQAPGVRTASRAARSPNSDR